MIPPATGEQSPIGAEGHGHDPIPLHLTGKEGFAVRDVPHARFTFGRPRSQQRSIRVEGHCKDIAEGFGKHRGSYIAPAHIDVAQIHPPQVGLPNGQVREVCVPQLNLELA